MSLCYPGSNEEGNDQTAWIQFDLGICYSQFLTIRLKYFESNEIDVKLSLQM